MDPFQELQNLQQQIAQVFRDGPGRTADPTPTSSSGRRRGDDDAYVVELELPGVKKSDVQIEIAAGAWCEGQRKEQERKGVMRRRTSPGREVPARDRAAEKSTRTASMASLRRGAGRSESQGRGPTRPRSITVK